ncbi:MAG TPA: hypothetical protein VJ719_15640 [Chthoniobacterales bacterium]|nr:hypothetical protein [Chthoniobacterales bacterium]
MALHLNLLHEQISEQRQRQRDPLKIGVMILVGIGALLFLYYGWNAYRTLAIKAKLSAIERDWSKVEPKVTAAEKRSAELNGIVKTTAVLDDYIEHRFFWGPFLEKLARCVAPNIQLTSVEGNVFEDKGVIVTIEGVAAAREPRSAAEDLRQMLSEQLSQGGYADVKVEFKALDDLDTIANVGGQSVAMAHYILSVTFQPEAAKGTPTQPRTPKR